MSQARTALRLISQSIPFIPPQIESANPIMTSIPFINDVNSFLHGKADGVYHHTVRLPRMPQSKVVLLKKGAESYILDFTPAGKGRSGQIEWALKLPATMQDKPEWVVIKKINNELTGDRNEKLNTKIDREYRVLELMGRAKGSLTCMVSEPVEKGQSKQVEQRWLIMEGEQGSDLAAFIASRRTMTAIDWLRLAESMAAEVSLVHSKGLIHRDLKLDNFMFHYLSRRVRLVDFGDAVLETQAEGILLEGTLGYDAPEVSLSNLESRVQSRSTAIYQNYSKATDIYALGKTFRKLFGFEAIAEDELHDISGLYNQRLLTELSTLFSAMISTKPGDRPAIPTVIARLQSIRGSLLPITYATVGIVDVTDCNQMIDYGLPVIPALKAVNEVVLITRPSKNTSKQNAIISKLKHKLEKMGVNVSGTFYLYSEDISILPNQLDATAKHESIVCMRCYCYFQHFQATQYPNVEGVKNIKIGDSTENNQEQINLAVVQSRETVVEKVSDFVVTEDDRKKVKMLLEAELERLNNRWWPKSGTSTLSCRLIDIGKALCSIENSKTPLTYQELFKTLDDLQAKMIPTMECLTWLFGIFGSKRTSKGAKNIATVKNEIILKSSPIAL